MRNIFLGGGSRPDEVRPAKIDRPTYEKMNRAVEFRRSNQRELTAAAEVCTRYGKRMGIKVSRYSSVPRRAGLPGESDFLHYRTSFHRKQRGPVLRATP